MFFLIAFILQVLLFTRLEQKLWGTLFTPLNAMMWPYTIATLIVIVYSLLDPDTPDFYLPSLVVWMVGLIIFFIPSIIFAKDTPIIFKKKGFEIEVSAKDDHYKLLRNIAFFGIAISLLKIRSISGQLDSFGTDSFSESYQSTGLFAHLGIIVGAIFPYAIYKYDKEHRKSAILIILGALVGMYAVGTKSWIIAPFLIGYAARILTQKTKFNLKTTLLPVILVFSIFFLSYYLSIVFVAGYDASNEFFLFVVTHFIDYFGGASLALSIEFKNGFIEPQNIPALFAPILNLFNAFFDFPYINTINPVFIDIGTLGSNNVRTFFGTIYAYSHSILAFIIIPLLFSTFIYKTYAASRKSKSIFLLFANISNIVFLIFAFFDFYWLTLTCYEFFILYILMHFILYKKKRKKIYT